MSAIEGIDISNPLGAINWQVPHTHIFRFILHFSNLQWNYQYGNYCCM